MNTYILLCGKLLFVFSLFSSGNASPYSSNDTRLGIFNGKEVKDSNEASFVVMVWTRLNETTNVWSVCGGSLINSRTVITAAHCLEDTTENYGVIHYGTYDKDESKYPDVEFEKFIIHPEYNGINGRLDQNDIAILRLKENVEEKQGVRFIKLMEHGDIPIGKTVNVYGWGATNDYVLDKEGSGPIGSRILLKAQMEVMPAENCNGSAELICLGSSESAVCVGDSGSGMVYEGRLAGVSSVCYFTDKNPCRANNGAGYANISLNYEWIRRTIESLEGK